MQVGFSIARQAHTVLSKQVGLLTAGKAQSNLGELLDFSRARMALHNSIALFTTATES